MSAAKIMRKITALVVAPSHLRSAMGRATDCSGESHSGLQRVGLSSSFPVLGTHNAKRVEPVPSSYEEVVRPLVRLAQNEERGCTAHEARSGGGMRGRHLSYVTKTRALAIAGWPGMRLQHRSWCARLLHTPLLICLGLAVSLSAALAQPSQYRARSRGRSMSISRRIFRFGEQLRSAATGG
jgi:hypothetical protein